MLIGSKEIFGIQFEITSISKRKTLYGKVALWLYGQYVGYFPEEMIIHSFNGKLLAIQKSARNISNDDHLLEFIESKDLETLQIKESGWYISQMGESFDDFTIAIIHNSDKVVFWWELARKDLGRHLGYPEDVQLVIVDKAIFNAVVEAYIESLPKGIIP